MAQYLASFFIVMCSGPKKSGDGTAAAGVKSPMIAAKPMIITKAGRLIPDVDNIAIPTAYIR